MLRTERNKSIYFPIKAAGITLLLIAVAFFVYLFLRLWMVPVTVSGVSMAPSLEEGDILLADRLFRTGRTLKRGDLVMFKNTENKYFIRRVIGMPGEMIEIVDGDVFINGCPLDESSYRAPVEEEKTVQMPILTLGAGEWFFLSDNRLYTSDSRDASIGPRNMESVYALIRFRVSPKGRAAFFK